MSDRPAAATLRPLRPATPRDRLIVALDVPDMDAAHDLVIRLTPAVRWFKIGSELFTAAGPRAVDVVLEHGGRVFLDLKFHDIPHTVAAAVASAVRLGVSMLNVHVAGGEAMMRAAAQARGGASAYVIGVTALTSTEVDVIEIVEMARRALDAELDGVVASPRETAAIKEACGSAFVVVTPGIRVASPVPGDDQRRVGSPALAIAGGSDFLVVGRPVLRAPDPLEVVERIFAEAAQGSDFRRPSKSER
jgi:orotidine-5'-phosphate decarboxylase